MGRGERRGAGMTHGVEEETGEEDRSEVERGGDMAVVVDEVGTNRGGRGDGRSRGARLVGHGRRCRGGGR